MLAARTVSAEHDDVVVTLLGYQHCCQNPRARKLLSEGHGRHIKADGNPFEAHHLRGRTQVDALEDTGAGTPWASLLLSSNHSPGRTVDDFFDGHSWVVVHAVVSKPLSRLSHAVFMERPPDPPPKAPSSSYMTIEAS